MELNMPLLGKDKKILKQNLLVSFWRRWKDGLCKKAAAFGQLLQEMIFQ
jgi:hypothetical protein